MWFRNKESRIRFITNAPEQTIPSEFIKELWEEYYSIVEKEGNQYKYSCTKCGHDKTQDKVDKYICECGYRHTEFKRKTFKRYDNRFVIKSLTEYENETISNYYLVFVGYDQESRLTTFMNPALIAKDIISKEKQRKYHYNIAYSNPFGYSSLPIWNPNKAITESLNTELNVKDIYYTPNQLNIDELKYINKNDYEVLGYKIDTLIDNAYLIELLQKYKSSYLFHQLLNRTRSNKLRIMFGFKETSLSNKQILSVIRYFSKSKSLDISLYIDYIHDLEYLKMKLNRSNLLNRNYEEKHQDLSKLVTALKKKNKDSDIKKRYSSYKEVYKNGIYIKYPKKQRDLNEESVVLNHCVRSYSEKIVEGKSLIFFIRTEPNTPMITAEIKDKKIEQFRGKDNLLKEIKPNVLSKAREVFTNYAREMELI